MQVQGFDFEQLVLTLRCPAADLLTALPGPIETDLTDYWVPVEQSAPPSHELTIAERREQANAETLVRTLLLFCLEAVAGQRAFAQLERMIDRRSTLGVSRMRRSLPQLRGNQPRQLASSAKLRTCSPGPATIEATAVLPIEPVRALAIRLEMHHGQWICTAFKML